MRLLLVEDDPMIGAGVQRGLKQDGHTVDWVRDGAAAELAVADGVYEVILLDLGLPRKSGLELLAGLRRKGVATPVLVITARDSVADRVKGLDAGADDYLAKPFEPAELVVRVRALVRRSAGHAEAVLRFGRLTLDTRRMAATVDGAPVSLSPLEYRLVHALAHSGGRPLSAGALAEALHGVDAIEANAIEAMVARLRRKLGADTIQTRRGFGYCLAGA